MTTTDRRITYARPALLGELAVVFRLVVAYDRIRDFAQARPIASSTDGARVLDLERFLHLDPERWLNLWVSSHETLAVVASWYYQLLHLSVSMAVLLACYVYRPDVYRAARNALVSISIIGLMVFWLFPVAPPRLLPGGGYIDTTAAIGMVGLVDSASANPFAAMPSLHLAWAVWSAMFAARLIRRRSLRSVAYAYPVVTTIVVMATANHYFLDVVAGAATTIVATTTTGTATTRATLAAAGTRATRPRIAGVATRAGSAGAGSLIAGRPWRTLSGPALRAEIALVAKWTTRPGASGPVRRRWIIRR